MKSTASDWWAAIWSTRTFDTLPRMVWREARLLQLVIIAFMVFDIGTITYYTIIFDFNTQTQIRILALVIGLFLFFYSLTLARKGKTQNAALLAVITNSLIIHFEVNFDFSPQFQVYFIYLVIPTILGFIYLSYLSNILIGLINIIAMVYVAYLHDTPFIQYPPVTYLVLSGITILAATRFRNHLEVDRQTDLAQQARRLEALRQAAFKLTGNLDLETLLKQLMQTTLELSKGAIIARIFLVDDGKITTGITTNAENVKMDLPWPRADGTTMQIANSGQEMILPDIQVEYKNVYPEYQGAMIGLPLKIEERGVGVMWICYPTTRMFESDELTTLRLLSDQAALAIKNARLFKSECEQRQLSQALANAVKTLNSSLDLETTLDQILSQILRVVGCDAANIALFSDNWTRVTRVMGYSEQDAIFQLNGKHLAVTETGNLNYMLTTGKAMMIQDTTVCPDWDPAAAPDWVLSFASAPLRIGDMMIGFLNLDSSQKNFFSESTLQILEGFANHAAIAIHNASAYKTEKDSLNQLEAIYEAAHAASSSLNIHEVLENFLIKCADLLPYTTASILVYAQDEPYVAAMVGLENKKASKLTIEIAKRILCESTLIEQVKKTRIPVLVNDTSREPEWVINEESSYIKSWMGIPMIARDEVIGLLSLDSEHAHAYTQEDLKLGELLAVEAAGAIHNARLYELAQKHSDELEQRVAERTAELKQSNEALEDFVFSITHDLRAPLRAIEGYANILTEDYHNSLDEDGISYASNIAASAHDLDMLIRGLLQYSRLSKVEIYHQTINTTNLLTDICHQLDDKISESEAQVVIDRPIPDVYAHHFTLLNVLTNLIDNAIKFVPTGVKPVVHIWSTQENGRVRINIQDNGIGIAHENQERIFHVFERLHGLEQYPGTGIGLAIVQKSMERMGGAVGVFSEPGSGSCFWIDVSAAPEAADYVHQTAQIT